MAQGINPKAKARAELRIAQQAALRRERARGGPVILDIKPKKKKAKKKKAKPKSKGLDLGGVAELLRARRRRFE
jgi:hypothetical protein